MVLWWIGNAILLAVVLPVVIFLLNRVLAALERIRGATDAAAVRFHGCIEVHRGCGCLTIVIHGPGAVPNCSHQYDKQHNQSDLLVQVKRFGAVLDGVVNFVLLKLFARNMV